ncbi:MAG: hypothetical protein ACFE7E_07255 [Candidatus Hodarchaeota archaeon]
MQAFKKRLVVSILFTLFLISMVSSIATPLVSASPDSADWWDYSWNHRVPVTVNTTSHNTSDIPIKIGGINFTQLLLDLGIGSPHDNNSIRVVEWNATSETNIELPSLFIPAATYDNSTNAVGDVYWAMNGTTLENTNRTFYIYFDTADAPGGPKSPPSYSLDPRLAKGIAYVKNAQDWRSWESAQQLAAELGTAQTALFNESVKAGSHFRGGWGWQNNSIDLVPDEYSMIIFGQDSLDGIEIPGKLDIDFQFRSDLETFIASGGILVIQQITSSNPAQPLTGIQFESSHGESYKKPLQQHEITTNPYDIRTESFNSLSDGFDTITDFAKYSSIANVTDSGGGPTGHRIRIIQRGTGYIIIEVLGFTSTSDVDKWKEIFENYLNYHLNHTKDSLDITIGMQAEYTIVSDVTVTVSNYEGLFVARANVTIVNTTVQANNLSGYNQWALTDIDGQVFFPDVPDNNYNITVTYVTNLGHTTSVLNNTFSNYNINCTQTLDLKVNINRLLVNITDIDNLTQYDLMPNWAEHYIVGLFNQSTGSPMANATTSIYYESGGVNWLVGELWWYNSSDNHQVKVFYEHSDYSNVLTLNETNIQFDSSISFNVNVSMTRLTVFARRFPTIDPLSNVVLELRNGTQSMANVTADDSGMVVFYWRTQPSQNYTIRAFYFDLLVPFIRFNESWSIFNESVGLPLPNAAEKVIDIQLGAEYETALVLTTFTSNVTYGENVTVAVYFNVTSPAPPRPVTGATATCYLRLGTTDIFVEIMTDAGSGYYTLTFNTTHYSGIIGDENRDYRILVTVEKPGYTSPTPIFVDLVIRGISSTMDYSISPETIYWGDFITVDVSYGNLEGATVSYTIGSWDFGIFNDLGNGNYRVMINTSKSAFWGDYLLRITAQKPNYEMKYIEAFLRVNQIQTLINGSRILVVSPIIVYAMEDRPIYFNYTTAGDIGINSTVHQYYWESISSGSGSGDLSYLGNGIYELDFNTSNKPVDDYTIAVMFEKSNYEARTATFNLRVLGRPTSFETPSSSVSTLVGSTARFSFYISDTLTALPLENVTLTLNCSIDPAYITWSNGSGWYNLTIDTVNLAPGIYDIGLVISQSNYATEIKSIHLTVEHQRILGMPWPSFVLMISFIVGAVAATGGIFRFYNWKKIPPLIRNINRSLKHMQQGEPVDTEKVFPDMKERDQILHEFLNAELEILGIKYMTSGLKEGSELLSIASTETPSEIETLESEIQSLEAMESEVLPEMEIMESEMKESESIAAETPEEPEAIKEPEIEKPKIIESDSPKPKPKSLKPKKTKKKRSKPRSGKSKTKGKKQK